jgi:hypothetical protein
VFTCKPSAIVEDEVLWIHICVAHVYTVCDMFMWCEEDKHLIWLLKNAAALQD